MLGKKLGLKLKGVAGAAVMMAVLGAGGAFGQGTIDLSVSPNESSGTGWEFTENVYTISGNVTVSGSNSGSTRRLAVGDNESSVTITLNAATVTHASPLTIGSGSNVTIELGNGSISKFDNPTTGGNISVGANSKLTIVGSGILEVKGVTGTGTVEISSANCVVSSSSNLSSPLTVIHDRGILFSGTNGNTGTQAGDVTLTADFTITSGRTLTVPNGVALTTLSSVTFTIAGNGRLINNGAIVNNGKIANSGTFTNNGAINNSAPGSTITGTITHGTGGTIEKTEQADLVISPVVGKMFGDGRFQLSTGTSGSGGGAVTYALKGAAAENAGTVTSGGEVTISRVGTITVTAVKGSDNDYKESGIAERAIEIGKRDIGLANNVTITVSGTYLYSSGTQHKPGKASIKVMVGSIEITDFTVTGHGPNESAGDSAGTVTVKVDDTNPNYTGSRTGYFKITPTSVNDMTMTLALPSTPYVYSGSPIPQADLPKVVVRRGTDTLKSPDDYKVEYLRNNAITTDFTNAGVITVRATLTGNVSGSRTAEFTIEPRPITVSADNSVVALKSYDGKRDGAMQSVGFANLAPVGGALAINRDYTASVTFNSESAGTGRTATVVVELTNSEFAKNYSLPAAASARTFTMPGQTIARAVIDTFHLVYAIPTDHGYTGRGRGIGNVTLRSLVGVSGHYTNGSSASNAITVLYNNQSAPPVDVGNYTVRAMIKGGTNFDSSTVILGMYSIKAPQKPTITAALPATATIREGGTLNLSVAATSPNDGTLSYRWYRDNALVSGATRATLSASGFKEGVTARFRAVVVNTKYISSSAGSEIDSALTGPVTVSVLEAAKNIAAASATVRGSSYMYSGDTVRIHSDSVVLTLDGLRLRHGTDFTYTVTNNLNAGSALVTITGVDAYTGNITARFDIAKRPLTRADVQLAATQVTYNGAAQPAVVRATNGRTGLGEMTLRYNGASAAPVNAGEYEVTAIIPEGQNFLAAATEFDMGVYNIVRKMPAISDLTFSIPPGGVKYDSYPKPVAVTIAGTGYGILKVLYDGGEEPPFELGSYSVTADISGGNNYHPALLPLGTLKIVEEPVSALAGGRDVHVDNDNSEAAAVMPQIPLTSKFTAGPNPVGRAGTVNFYYTGSSPVGGNLTIYDASGNVVRRINVNGGVTAWDMKDAKGRAVAAGTYLVKGAINTANGKRNRVSLVVGVW